MTEDRRGTVGLVMVLAGVAAVVVTWGMQLSVGLGNGFWIGNATSLILCTWGGVLGWTSFRTGRGRAAGVLGVLMIVGFVVVITTVLSWWPPDTDLSPELAYRVVAGLSRSAPIPAGVTDLQADGADWMDLSIRCRFTASPEVMDVILATGYEAADWGAVKAELSADAYTDGFSPKWAPEDVAMKECYIKRVDRRDSTDELYLVVDRERGVVYAAGSRNMRRTEDER
jgi:hypothetical protein